MNAYEVSAYRINVYAVIKEMPKTYQVGAPQPSSYPSNNPIFHTGTTWGGVKGRRLDKFGNITTALPQALDWFRREAEMRINGLQAEIAHLQRLIDASAK